MKRVFETAECEEVRNSIFLVQRYEKHENQMKLKGCVVAGGAESRWLADERVDLVGLWYCKTVLFNVFFEMEPFAAILIDHGTHGLSQKFV